jgi:hypothetical protein
LSFEETVVKKALKIALLTPLFILLALILAGTCYQIWYTEFRTPDGPGRWTSESPDGRFIITAYSNKGLRSLIPTMPGDGGFGPGIVILRENKTGKILQQAKVENLDGMAGYAKWMIGDPDAPWRKGWATAEGPREGDYVRVGLLGTWPLPSEDGKLPPPLK